MCLPVGGQIIMHSIDELLSLHIQCNWVFKHWRLNTKIGLLEIFLLFEMELFLLFSFDIVIVIGRARVWCTLYFTFCFVHLLFPSNSAHVIYRLYLRVRWQTLSHSHKQLKLHLHISKNRNTTKNKCNKKGRAPETKSFVYVCWFLFHLFWMKLCRKKSDSTAWLKKDVIVRIYHSKSPLNIDWYLSFYR